MIEAIEAAKVVVSLLFGVFLMVLGVVCLGGLLMGVEEAKPKYGTWKKELSDPNRDLVNLIEAFIAYLILGIIVAMAGFFAWDLGQSFLTWLF